MKFNLKTLALALAIAGAPLLVHAASTINPAVPAPNSPMSSAPIRNNFGAAYTDINNILSKFGANTAPLTPSTRQDWFNTTTSTAWVWNVYDGSQWVSIGTLNPTTHVWTAATGGSVTSFSGGTTGLTPATATTGAVTLAGTLNVGHGGTGATTITGLVLGNGTSAMTAFAGSSGSACSNQFTTNTAISAAGVVTNTCTTDTLASAQHANQGTTTTVLHGNASGNPSWGAVSLTADVSGTLPVGNGGTGATSLTAHGILLGEGTSAITPTAAMTDGQLLVGQSSADPLPKTMSGDATLSAAGALTIANNAVTNAKAAQMTANTMKGNWTGSTANAADNAMPSCPATGNNHLNYVSGTGITCGTNAGGTLSRYTDFVGTNYTATNSSEIMAGFGSSWTITPATTGHVRITVTGYFETNALNGTIFTRAHYGTGSAPSSGSAASGTAMTTKFIEGTAANASAPWMPFTFIAEVSSLTLSTAYWWDMGVKADSGTFDLQIVSTIIEELPN